MNKTIPKPRASRKENGPVVGNTLKLLNKAIHKTKQKFKCLYSENTLNWGGIH